MKEFLYWDEEAGYIEPDRLSVTKSGTPIVNKNMKKQTRPQKLYNDFKALSQIEKENFVNMIRNFVVHGHL